MVLAHSVMRRIPLRVLLNEYARAENLGVEQFRADGLDVSRVVSEHVANKSLLA